MHSRCTALLAAYSPRHALRTDHGWSLGENGEWRKFHLSELGTRVPLLVSVPWLPRAHGRRTAALVELVDVFPTLSALAGLPDPTIHPGDAPLDGISLLPLFSAGTGTGTETNESGKRKGRPFAISQYPRCPVNQTDPALLWQDNWCIEVSSSNFSWMGYSIRNVGRRCAAPQDPVRSCQWLSRLLRRAVCKRERLRRLFVE